MNDPPKPYHRTKEHIQKDIQEKHKTCVVCGQRKPFSCYTKQSNSPDGKANQCKDCLKVYRQTVKERQQEWAKQYNISNREQIQKKGLMRRYGVTDEWYFETLKNQKYTCDICESPEALGNGNKYFHVDHNHKTGKVRGLLCSRCNTALGNFRDSKETLLKAVEYLTKHEKEN